MRYRKLRIAWSVVCSVLEVLLIVFWVRSYWRVDEAALGSLSDRFIRIALSAGEFAVSEDKVPPAVTFPPRWDSLPQMEGHTKLHPDFNEPRWASPIGFRWKFIPTAGMIIVPLWFLTGLAAILAVAPWIRPLSWRFSLRTLLIVTTLVAVMLGLIVWL
jgi:hypothetical protein